MKNPERNLRELRSLKVLLKNSPRSRLQKNRLFESDCEILKLNSTYLALTLDSVSEEIYQALYHDPYTWGWITVMSSVSDLAASGASPLGLLLATEWKIGAGSKIKTRFFKGVNAALKASKMVLLGGDSGESAEYFFSSTAIGESKKLPLMRTSVKPGDYIALVGREKLGIGPALALRFLHRLPLKQLPEKHYRPQPKPWLMQKLRPLIRASIDTSDGLASSLNIISKLNRVGFCLEFSSDSLHPKALKFCRDNAFHPLMLWMGDLGDYQTLVFISPKNIQKAQKKCAELLLMGRVSRDEKHCSVSFQDQSIELPLAWLGKAGRDLASIKRLSQKLQKYFTKV